MIDHSVPNHFRSCADRAHLRFLQTVRAYELDRALAHFPSADNGETSRTVLEIGAGTGQQAKSIEDRGYAVVAIDLPSSHYRDDRVYGVLDYDGRNIPMANGSADVVFSSNVLEHVCEIDAFLDETRRVMAENGVAIHVLPSSACRAWSLPAHYLWLVRRVFSYVFALSRRSLSEVETPHLPRVPHSSREWIGTFFPLRHGERGTSLTEPYYYSRYWWCRKFRQHGFIVTRVEPNELFYTMANALNDSLGIPTRRWLAHLLGSACHVYVLKRRTHPVQHSASISSAEASSA